MNKDLNNFKKEIKSFGHAFKGVATFFMETRHAKFHALAAILVVSLGILFSVSKSDWISLLVCIAMVFISESMNSAIEYVVDLASPDYHLLAKKAKDVAAGAVLIASVFTVIVAFVVFYPYLFDVFTFK